MSDTFFGEALAPGQSPRSGTELGQEVFGLAARGQVSRWRMFPTGSNGRYNYRTAIPLLGRGSCLDPWISDDDILWYDPTVEPANDDIVVVELEYKRLSGGSDRVRAIAVKQLQISGSRRVLVCGEGAIDATGSTILGVVCGWRRSKWWRRPSVRKMALGFQLGGDRWAKSGR